MSKEMIVSVNGREKKIAIIENGQVTEFYIERGEASAQGIVGNIYKGRVMRVLPGMQSAFVDIGLERDAFLYVSDFFDEEEEFERIVIEKPKPEIAAITAEREIIAPLVPAAAAAAVEKIPSRQSRGEREERPRAEISLRARPEPITDQKLNAAPETSDEEISEAGGGGRRRRRRRGGRSSDGAHEEAAISPSGRSADGGANTTGEFIAGMMNDSQSRFDEASPFAATMSADSASSFERVIDDEAENDAAEGAMLKDAILQERLFDQIRAGEFNIEATLPVEVGSLLSTASDAAFSFQRIDDSEVETNTAPRSFNAASQVDESLTPKTSVSLTPEFIDSIMEDDIATVGRTASLFERISDDESRGFEERANSNEVSTGEIESETVEVSALMAPTKRKRTTRGIKSKQAAEGSARATNTSNKEPVSGKVEAAEDTSQKKRSSGSRASSTNRTPANRRATTSSSTKRSNAKTPKSSVATVDSESNGGAELTDAKASVTSSRARGEFSSRRRRGGSRRRPNRAPAEVVAIDEENKSGEGNDGGDAVQTSEPEALELTTRDVLPETVGSSPSVSLASSPVTTNTISGGGGNRTAANNRQAHNGGNGRGGGGQQRQSRERHAPPMITDLLREGQEIIVQIAKEPISQKGARITSHIALPGRFLVYMPTIEHVGVSRKIESDSERVRLRKLIQAIRAEEDVPSGGFIVRTAGTGITEMDLREDARYLVRTWRDIRRAAEKQKAPALAHRDLDLVQRILRDHLSDDFTAIRVDSEEEYMQIAEFVNRIQPRLVNRVKLYTRDEPILEAFGVQAEIDKAIKPRVWLRSGGYLVINQTEALVAIDVNTGKFVGRGGSRLEDTITKTNLEAVDEIARQIRLRDLGGIIVLDLIDMDDRRNRQRVLQALHEALENDKSPTKVLSFNDFGLVIMTRKRVKQSLERTLCAPCPYCQGAGLVKSGSTVCYEILEEARRLARSLDGERVKQTTLRVNPEIARALRSTERDVLTEIEDYLGAVDITSDEHVHQEQFDFAFV